MLEIVPEDDDDDVTIEETPLSSKSPTIVDYKIYKEGKKSYFKIIRADGNSQNYLTFGKMFKNFNIEDLEVLWSIVKERFKKTKPVDAMDNPLFQTLKTMFEHKPPQQTHQDQIHSTALVLPSDPFRDQIYRSTPHHLAVTVTGHRHSKKKKRNITMAMISAFTIVDKTAYNSRTTSRDLWLSFEKAYAPHSTSKEYSLKTQLLRIEMCGDETLDAYLNRTQEYVDALAAIDTRANSHVTPNLEAMNNSEAYYGDDTLHVGNTQKFNVYSTFKSFVQMVERQFTTKLKNVQTDWGGEFCSLASFFSSLGIIHRRSCPHTSEQNGFVERRNRHVVETDLTLFAQACVPQRFWHYAFDTAVYLINRMPSRTSKSKSPFEHIFKRSPGYSFLRVFGCLCFPHLRPYNRHKMDFCSTLCVFLGYSPSHHGYRCLDISIERLYIARHVRFNEAQFPFDIPETTSPPPSKTSPYYSSESPYVIPTIDYPSPSSPHLPISSSSSVLHLSPTSQTSLKSSNVDYIDTNTTTTHTTITSHYSKTMWSLVPRASNMNVVDGKWVYMLNHDKNGVIFRYKARFVAKGFWKQPGIDFHESFSPVVKLITIQDVLSLEVTNEWPLRQLDIQNAFLHGNLKEQHVSDILLSQKKYILELLQSAGLSNCNLVASPMVTSSSLSLDDSTAFSNPVKYRQVLGSLQYVTLSRHDMAFVVNKVCQYMHAPIKNHWSVVKQILRYLHGMVKHGMLICRSGSTLQAFTDVLWKGNLDTSLEAFSYADWARDLDDRWSTGGFSIYHGLNLISWTARKQCTVSRSSTEAEYKALADTVAELTWLQALNPFIFNSYTMV
nr:retrovirus-related Pol polyprotein from transposon TNT 1-94 [Tanacetum cinerariifolium]